MWTRRAAIALVAVAGVTISAVVFAMRSEAVTVERVVDGDTIDVIRDGTTVRVRLLNVDAPESVDPNTPDECLGGEAAQWLKDRLPPGTVVTLQNDVERTDQYGRELAAVFVDDTLINAELARAGLAEAVVYGQNDEYYETVRSAAFEAAESGRGLFDGTIECTAVHQIAVAEEQLAAEQAPPAGADPAAFDAYTSRLDEIAALLAVARGTTLDDDSDSVRRWGAIAFTDRRAREFSMMAAALTEQAHEQRAVEVARVEEERRREEEAARLAEEARQAEAARQAEEARRAESTRRTREAEERQTRESSGSSTSSSGGGESGPAGYPNKGNNGYTGCRAYAPGGVWWKPIPCP